MRRALWIRRLAIAAMVVIAIAAVRSFWNWDLFYDGDGQTISLLDGCVLYTYPSETRRIHRNGSSGHISGSTSPTVQNIERALWGFIIGKGNSPIFDVRHQTFQFNFPLWPLLLVLFVVGRPRWENKKEKKKPTVQMGWFDEQFTTIGWPMLIALSVLFTVLMWIFSGWALLVARNPVARRKAKMIFIVLSLYLLLVFLLILFYLAHLPPAGTAA